MRLKVNRQLVWSMVLLGAAMVACEAAQACGVRRTIRKDKSLSERYDVYDNERHVGSVRQDPFVKDSYELRDNAGRTQQTIRRDPFREDRYEVFEDQKRTGTLRKDPFLDGRYELRDDSGRKQGELRRDPFVGDQWEFRGE